MSVSDDEGPEGWRIIERHPRVQVDRGKHGIASTSSGAGTQGMAAPRIKRSRTVPSSRNGRASTWDAGAAQRGTGPSGSTPSPAVLRKVRRASAQPT